MEDNLLYSKGGGIAGSSNGRTLGSGPSNLGSSPSPAAYFKCLYHSASKHIQLRKGQMRCFFTEKLYNVFIEGGEVCCN